MTDHSEKAADDINVAAITDRLGVLAQLSSDMAASSLALPEIEAKISAKALANYFITAMLCALLGTALWLSIVAVLCYSIALAISTLLGMLCFIGINLLAMLYLLHKCNSISATIGFPRTINWLSSLLSRHSDNQQANAN